MTSPSSLNALIKASVSWKQTDDVDFPYELHFEGVHWKIRLNDFPDEPLFSVFENGRHVADFDDWPAHWQR